MGLLALVYPILLGLDRIETATLLHSDETSQYLTGLQSFLDPTDSTVLFTECRF